MNTNFKTLNLLFPLQSRIFTGLPNQAIWPNRRVQSLEMREKMKKVCTEKV